MKKFTQHDLCVLALTELGGWRRAYELEKKVIGKQMIGSEADTRLYELFGKNVADADRKTTERKIEGDTYTIETMREGGERWWKAYLSGKKPVFVPPARKRAFVENGQTVWREVDEKGELLAAQ